MLQDIWWSQWRSQFFRNFCVLCLHDSTKKATSSRAAVTARLHSAQLKCLRDTFGPSCEKDDACRQNRVLCLCEIMRTSTSGQTLFAINVFFFSCVKSLGSAKRLRLIIARKKLWSGYGWGNWNTLNCFFVDRGAKTKEKLFSNGSTDSLLCGSDSRLCVDLCQYMVIIQRIQCNEKKQGIVPFRRSLLTCCRNRSQCTVDSEQIMKNDPYLKILQLAFNTKCFATETAQLEIETCVK